MDLGLLLFGIFGMAYGLTNKPNIEPPKRPELPECPDGCHYEYISAGEVGYIIPMVVPNKKEK